MLSKLALSIAMGSRKARKQTKGKCIRMQINNKLSDWNCDLKKKLNNNKKKRGVILVAQEMF